MALQTTTSSTAAPSSTSSSSSNNNGTGSNDTNNFQTLHSNTFLFGALVVFITLFLAFSACGITSRLQMTRRRRMLEAMRALGIDPATGGMIGAGGVGGERVRPVWCEASLAGAKSVDPSFESVLPLAAQYVRKDSPELQGTPASGSVPNATRATAPPSANAPAVPAPAPAPGNARPRSLPTLRASPLAYARPWPRWLWGTSSSQPALPTTNAPPATPTPAPPSTPILTRLRRLIFPASIIPQTALPGMLPSMSSAHASKMLPEPIEGVQLAVLIAMPAPPQPKRRSVSGVEEEDGDEERPLPPVSLGTVRIAWTEPVEMDTGQAQTTKKTDE